MFFSKKASQTTFMMLALAFLLDQFSKTLASTYSSWELFVYKGIFDVKIAYVLNPHFAFSIPAPEWLILGVVAIVFSVVLYVFKLSLKRNKYSAPWIALLLGGALGNLVDRLRFSAVQDFISIGIPGWNSLSFNIADILILVGVIGWIYINQEENYNGIKVLKL